MKISPIRYILALVTAPTLCVLYLNMEVLAQEHGYDRILVGLSKSAVASKILPYVTHPISFAVSSMALGLLLGGLLTRSLTRKERKAVQNSLLDGSTEKQVRQIKEQEELLQSRVAELERQLRIARIGADPKVASRASFHKETTENAITFRATSGSSQTVDIFIEMNCGIGAVVLKRHRICSNIKLAMNEEIHLKIVSLKPPEGRKGWSAYWGDPDGGGQAYPMVIHNEPAAVVVSSSSGEGVFYFYLQFDRAEGGSEPKVSVIGRGLFGFANRWDEVRRNQAEGDLPSKLTEASK